MTKTFYIFLDVDGVLNNETYTVSCYERHHKSMHMNHVPFDPKCLNNLMILVQSLEKLGFEVKIILSSTWRLSNIDYELLGCIAFAITGLGFVIYGCKKNKNK